MKSLSLEERRAQANLSTKAAIQAESEKVTSYVPGDRGLRKTVTLGADTAASPSDDARFVQIEARLAMVEEQQQSQSGVLAEFTNEKETRERVTRHHEEFFAQADKHFVAIETRLTRQAELEASNRINSEQARLLLDKRLVETIDRQQLHADAIFNLDGKISANRDQTAALGKRTDEHFSEVEQRQNQQAETAASNRAADERVLNEHLHRIDERFDQIDARIDAIKEQQRVQAETIQRIEVRPTTWAEVFVIIREMITGCQSR